MQNQARVFRALAKLFLSTLFCVLFLCGNGVSANTPIIIDGLVGSWDFNGDALDSSGNGNHGIANNVVWEESTQDDKNIINEDYYLRISKNISRYIILPENIVNGLQDLTISAWVKRTDNNLSYYPLVNGFDNSFNFGFLPNGDIEFVINKDFADKIYYNSNFLSTKDKWVFVTFVIKNNTIFFYENAILSGSASRQNKSVTNVTGLVVGQEQDSKYGSYDIEQSFGGDISGLQLFERALSSEEIEYLFLGKPKNNSNSSSNPSENSQSTIEYIPTSEYTLAHYNAGIAAITPTNSQDAGDPVLLHSGEFTYANSVMQYSAPGMPFDFSLSYRNQTYYNGPVGNNFDHSYNQFLVEQDGNLYYYDGKLGVYEFTGSGGIFEKNTLLRAQIAAAGSGYTLNFENGNMLSFNADLKLEGIEDIFGNEVSLSYDSVNHNLTNITDTQGRSYSLSYNDDLRLETLTDFTGNSVELSYYGSGETLGSEHDLQDITLHNGSETKTISFTYSPGSDDTSKHNLRKLIDAAGNTYVENTYDAQDRVIAQVYGNGTLSYNYLTDSNTGKITQNTVADREGNTTVYSYDAAGNTLSRTSGGNSYSYEYNSENRIITEIYPRGNGYSYSYDAFGNLVEKRFKTDMSAADSGNDLVTSYEYTSNFPTPTKITLPNGFSTNYQINSLGQITQSSTSSVHLGNTSSNIVQNYSYDSIGNLIAMTDALGNTVSYSYSGNLLISETKSGVLQNSYSYDAARRMTSQSDALGNETQYEYDAFGNLSASTSPEGIVQEFSYSENNKLTQSEKIIDQATSALMQTDYDNLDYPTEIREEIAEGTIAITQLEYNGNEQISKTILPSGAQIEYSYDAQGNMLSQTLSSDEEELLTSYSYDANGNRISQNREGVITSYSYDLFDRLRSMTDALGTTTSYSYNTLGNITHIVVKDAQNKTLQDITRSYNERGDMLSETLQSGSETRERTLIYDALGNIISQTDFKGNTQNYSYDDFGRLESQTDPYGKTISYDYDAAGRLIQKTQSTQGKSIETSYSYDDDGKLLSETDELGNTVSYVYNTLGQMIQKTDAKGNVTSYSYDYSGNMLSETSAGNTLRYYYDQSGNLTAYRDAKGGLTTYTLNQRGQKSSEMDAQGNFTDYSYNTLGELIQIQDANGNTIAQSYDALGRLIQRDIQRGSNIGGVTQESYQYDGLGRLVGANDSENQALSFSYNGFGDLISETNGGKTIDYSYDAQGNLISQSLDGEITTLSYDAQKRIESIAYNTQNIISYSYDSFGETGFTLGNGIETNKTFDALQRLESLTSSAISPTGTQTSFSYSYDSNSMMSGNSRDFYSYDAQNQLTQHLMSDDTLGVGPGQAYSYDAMGNRTRISNLKILSGSGAETQTKLGGYRNYDSNELNQYTDFYTPNTPHENGLLYDANGNLTQNNVTTNSEFTYEYDYKNRPIKVTRINPSNGATVVSEYRYDVLGRRAEKRVNTKTTSYTYAGENVIYETLTNTNPSNGNILLKSEKYFVYGNKGVDDILYMKVVTPIETKEYYYEKDERGSILRLSDSSGTVVEEYRYDAFGQSFLYRTDLNKYQALGMAGPPSGNTRLFTGREYDNDAMLYYMRARYYEPKLGKFISRDPIGILDNMNLYTYVGNNPVMFVDLFGKAKKFIAAYDDFLQAESAYWNNINLITEMEYYFIMQEKEEIAKQLHYARNQFNIDLPGSIEEAEELKWRIVRSDYHQYNTEEGKENIKYVSPDGYKEIIFRYDGKIDDSVENRGTYNFFDPDGLSGINHILYDVKPWERWGTAPGDQNYLNY